MKLREVKDLLEATVETGDDLLDAEVGNAFGSDMMSEVLAYVQDQGVLMTGLVNEQVIRTAAMMNMECVVMVRGKTPTPNMIAIAKENEVCILRTDLTLYESSGRLYVNGMNPTGHHYV